jgi:hypothetical protein
MSGDFSSWRPTAEERRRLTSALIGAAGVYLGVPLELAEVARSYFYNRRDMLFTGRGVPKKAYSQGKGVSLSALAQAPSAQRLTLNVDLAQSARELGLRDGDPVTIVLTGQAYVRTAGGLVVPARVGQPVEVAVPQGNYRLAAFGSRQDSLFTTPDPFIALGGNNLAISWPQALAVPLSARQGLPAGQQAPVAGCDCAQCQAARNQVPAAGCDCAQCQAARAKPPALRFRQPPVQAGSFLQRQIPPSQGPVDGCACAACQAQRQLPGCNCPQCQAARG